LKDIQSAAAVLMIRPQHFASNAETLASNRFQTSARGDVAAAARAEFDALAAALTRAGIDVHVFAGRADSALADEIFPNNWISFHADGTVVLYPMMAPSRRLERRRDVVDALERLGYGVRRIVDLSAIERDGYYLEGTGSLVLDRPRRVAYACLSPRTSPGALAVFAERAGYEIEAFEAFDGGGHPIYHTNVMLSVGTGFVVVCSAAIANSSERSTVLKRLADGGRIVIDIEPADVRRFAANILELRGRAGPVIALSAAALAAFGAVRRRALAAHGTLVSADIGTIETYGGGSVRCMLAEVHLPAAGDVSSPKGCRSSCE
jgi:hypothetical protein